MEVDIEALIKKVIDCAYKVHCVLGIGFEEKVYHNALIVELKKYDFSVESELPLNVYYENVVVGHYKADIIVNRCLILELKAVSELTLNHEIQLVNYLNATGINDGLLINFGTTKFKPKRKFRSGKN